MKKYGLLKNNLFQEDSNITITNLIIVLYYIIPNNQLTIITNKI